MNQDLPKKFQIFVKSILQRNIFQKYKKFRQNNSIPHPIYLHLSDSLFADFCVVTENSRRVVIVSIRFLLFIGLATLQGSQIPRCQKIRNVPNATALLTPTPDPTTKAQRKRLRSLHHPILVMLSTTGVVSLLGALET